MNVYEPEGAKTLRKYLSLGPKITTEGFLYIENYKYLNVTNNTFSKHVYADSMVK